MDTTKDHMEKTEELKEKLENIDKTLSRKEQLKEYDKLTQEFIESITGQ